MSPRLLIAFGAILAGLAAPISAQTFDRIFRATFDPAPAAFRTTALRLIDPHLYVSFGICSDIVSQVNDQITASLTTDSDADGLYDNSPLTLFRPLNQSSLGFALESVNGDCTFPTMANPNTVCDMDRNSIPQAGTYTTVASGSCSGVVAGSASAYSPSIAVPAAPCFQTAPNTLSINFGGVAVSLIAASSAGTFNANPATSITSGLQRGFLRESDANNITIQLPVVGPRVLSSLLPGGTGSCNNIANGRDTFNSVTGWWFYFNSTQSAVQYVGP